MAGEKTGHRSLGYLIARRATPVLAGLSLLGAGVTQAATITVNSTADNTVAGDGDCTLREAISNANNGAGGDTTGGDCTAGEAPPTVDEIDLSGLAGQTITLDNTTIGSSLTVTETVSVTGDNSNPVVLDGNYDGRVMQIYGADYGGGDYTDVELTGLTLQNGSVSGAHGGGLYASHTDLRISNTTVSGNESYAYGYAGGGIFAYQCNTTVTDSDISGNSAYFGGGITQLYGRLTVTGSSIDGNSGPRAGGGIVASFADSTITDSTISGNSATRYDGFGGGVVNGYATMTLTRTTISGNSATYHGGGLSSYYGSTMVLNDSVVMGNQVTAPAGLGGGISNFSTLEINRSVVDGNTAYIGGGGIFGLGITMDQSVVSNNSASGFGGGLYVRSTTSDITNSTISANSATTAVGGILQASQGTLNLVHSTVSGNSAADFSGNLFLYGTLNMTDSLIVNSQGGYPNCFLSAPYTVNANAASFADDTSCGGPTYNTTAGYLGPLAFNGGPTQTHALCTGAGTPDASCAGANVAIDAATTSSETADQRGVPRPIGSYADSGAFESGATFDFGDAPDPAFPTLLTSDGAAHMTNAGTPFLGSGIDSEADGLQSADAQGDDNDNTDDEDGITLTSAVRPGTSATLDVTVDTATLLNAWADFNQDGDWDDAGEQIFTDEALVGGTNSLVVAVPASAGYGETFTRFRVSSAGGDATTGLSVDGEVEDHEFFISPLVSLSLAGSPLAENGGVATVTASIPGVSNVDTTVTLSTSGTAAASDFTLGTTSLVIPAGSTSADTPITGVDDSTDEPDETVIVDIDSVTNGAEDGTQQVTATITDDDATPTVRFTAASASLPESAGSGSLAAFTLSNPSSMDVTVSFAVTGGTATAGTDFTIDTASPVTIPAGSTSASVAGTLIDDVVDEPDETVIVKITGATNATPGAPGTFTGTILDNDLPPEIPVVGDDDDEDDCDTALEYLALCIGTSAMTPADFLLLAPLALVGLWRRRFRLQE